MVCGVLGVGYEAVSSNNLLTDGTEDHSDPVGQGYLRLVFFFLFFVAREEAFTALEPLSFTPAFGE